MKPTKQQLKKALSIEWSGKYCELCGEELTIEEVNDGICEFCKEEQEEEGGM